MMISNFGWMVIALILPTCVWKSEEACRNHIQTGLSKIFYAGRDLNITVEVSNRITHQIVSHILIILLKEVLGYVDVEAVHVKGGNPISTLQRITGCKNSKDCPQKQRNFVPETMISLELWLGPGFNTEEWIQTGGIIDCGPLGPIGRTGWYIQDKILNDLWNESIIIDHWRAFQLNPIAAIFAIPNKELERFMKNEDTGKYYCDLEKCDEGFYEPIQCRKPKLTCATLLVDYPESTFSILKSEIDYLELLVRVAWVGPNLESLVRKRTESEKPNATLFFNWKPNTVTSLGNFTNVAFPHCEDKYLPETHCEYEVNQLEKVIWPKIKTNAPEVFHLIRSMTFTQQNYLSLLKTYNLFSSRGQTVENVACMWVEQNQKTWHKWLLKGFEKPKLYIGGIFPMNGTYWHQSGIIIAAKMAVDAVNLNTSILSNYNLELIVRDGHCAADEVMKSFINYVTNATYKDTIGILGPACSDTVEPIAGVAKHYNTIIISYSAEGALVSNREKYPYFFRTIPENSQLKIVYLKLFQSLNWNRVAALTEDGRKYPEYISLLHDKMQQSGMNFLTNRKFPRGRASHNMSHYLLDLKNRNAKIIIGDFYDSAARSVMCEAYKQGMTAQHGYQWFLPPWFERNWFDTDYYNQMVPIHETVSCTTKQMIDAINGHMSLAYKYYSDNDETMQEQKSVGEWREDYQRLAKRQNQMTSIYGGYAYDAVWVYAYALHDLLKENHTHVANLHLTETSRRYVELLNSTNFKGVSGDVYFQGSSRISDVILWQWRDNITHKIGIYHPNGPEDGNLTLNKSSIKWMTTNGEKPNDGTEGKQPSVCPLESIRALFNVSCEIAIVIVNIMGFLTFAIVMLVGFIIFKRRYELKMKRTEARMRELGLMSSSNLLTLDEWEMPREYIVINRKLGEGAFGTVYGGESFITDKGWIAVAVKTLKMGATVEEKLDFLSEAEMMKRFDHKNIVQLVGVCTVGEPVYTVMEFMLYGDLKTFLLGRRHLVKEKEHEKSDEVSDRKLTNMALDVARGLSYLADLKYVHRDLACRNCLVNASRTVKIADFGMCRPMYDSDYYRFNKRGMLPVRWMAPESLIDGIFTPTSDIWSYGVLLYEIITFGSFPYQGLSNNQVLDYVKGFNTLPVPNGCKPELASLLLRCWCRKSQDRPSASEIVEILANHPKLIAPCLDMPMASVEVEDTDSLELTICERTRLHSMSSSWPAKRQNGSLDQSILYREKQDNNRAEKCASVKRRETSPVIDSPRVALQKGQYLTLQQKGTRGDSDYGSDVSQDFPQSITSL